MAVYTVLGERELAEVVEDYGLVKLTGFHGIPTGSVNTHYLLETARGRHLLRIDEVKGELEVKRELDLLLFLRKHGFPCPQPVQDRKNRYYREGGGKCLSVYRYYDGHALRPDRDVPWHRVINSQGKCSTGRVVLPSDKQQRMLEREGVKFDKTGRCDLETFIWNPRSMKREKATKTRGTLYRSKKPKARAKEQS